MDLSARLSLLGAPLRGAGRGPFARPGVGGDAPVPPPASSSPAPDPGEPGLHACATRPARVDVAHLLSPVPARETKAGKVYLLATSEPAALDVSPQTLAALAMAEPFAAGALERPLLLDTETTGLAGGTGTVAFVVGLARAEAGSVRVEQAFLPGYADERAMLEWLRAEVEASTLLVTFNGKAFDWPLLKNRFVMNRLAPPPERPHVDLLHAARRVFRRAIPQLRLTALEREVLGHEREGDLDGAEIPDAWFDWLRTGRVATVMRVLEHNAWDLVGMARLLTSMARLWDGAEEASPDVALGLAELASRRGEYARALLFGRRATLSPSASVRALALELLGDALKRQGDPSGAAKAWREALALCGEAPHLHVALAKLYEHQLGSPAIARHHAERGRGGEPEVDRQRRLSRLGANQEELRFRSG